MMSFVKEPHNFVQQTAPKDERVVKSESVHRVWLLTNAPSPYQAELLTAISNLDEVGLDVRFMLAGSPSGRAASSRFPFRVMRSVTPRFLPQELLIHPRAVWECAVSKQNCFVLSGLYTSLTFLLCALVLTARRVPWIVWFERPHPGRREEGHWSPRLLMTRPVRALRSIVQKWILKSATRVLCIGSAAREAYGALGVPRDRLDVLPYCCDVNRYERVDPATTQLLRQRYNIDDKTLFLFSGQMIERKGVDTAISAFTQIAKERDDVAIILLGDGPLRAKYEGMVPETLRSRVHFPGHVDQKELPAYFLAADVFVFPSRHDGWGVVINEACAAGLPIITTHQTGAAFDLVEDGRSGFVLERDDIEGFATRMQCLLDDLELREMFGERSRELVQQFSPEHGAIRFNKTIAACTQA